MANRLLAFALLAHEVAQKALPERAHRFAPKRYTQPQFLACLLVKEYLRLDYRTAQEALEVSDGLRDALGLAAVPDYSTLWRFAHDKATADVVAGALAETVRLFKASGQVSGPCSVEKLRGLSQQIAEQAAQIAERKSRCRSSTVSLS